MASGGHDEPLLQFFTGEGYLDAEFRELAMRILDNLPRCSERTVALRKLLEAKEAAVRAQIMVL